MTANDPRRRVLLALTESAPVQRLWQAVLDQLREGPADVCAVFVVDERWQQAASLPGTLEISRVSGTALEFTRERADELCRAAAARARQDIERRAAEAQLRLSFDVLADSVHDRLKDLLSDEQILVIAPARLRTLSAYSIFEGLRCRIVIVDESDEPR